jgi:hypothetical protein
MSGYDTPTHQHTHLQRHQRRSTAATIHFSNNRQQITDNSNIQHPKMALRNSLDNEIQVIPPNSHPTTVYTKLSYDWREETGVDKAQW